MFGGFGLYVAWSVAVNNSAFVDLAGYLTDQTDFDPDPFATYAFGSPESRYDGFAHRLRQS